MCIRDRPFGGDEAEQRPLMAQSRGSGRIDPESIRGGESQRPHDAERILLKPEIRITHGPEQPLSLIHI